MAIKSQSEKAAHKEFLRYQVEMERALKKLHDDTAVALIAIIARNATADGIVDTYKIKKIVDEYMDVELRIYRTELTRRVRIGVSDSSTYGVRSIIGATKPHLKATADRWVDIAAKVRKEIMVKRGIDGLKLSDRVWKLTRDNTFQLKKIVAGDILNGTSADRMSRDIRGFLRQPATLRGSVRDALQPGQGVYKSAYKNALRLTRSETNKAYQNSQKETAKVMGYKLRWMLSHQHPEFDICDDYAGKVYSPEDFPAYPHPHCYDKETQVYTEAGWKHFVKLKSERVLSLNPDTHAIEYLRPVNKVAYHHDGTMLHFKSKILDAKVTPDHNMYVDRSGWILKPAHQLWAQERFYGGCKWTGTKRVTIQIGKKMLPISLYCKLMGWYLSEGCTTKRKGYNTWQITIAQKKYKNEMTRDLKPLPYKVNICQQGVRIYDEDLGRYLLKYGKSYQKYVPDIIKTLKAKYIKTFLRAYCMGDGSTRKAHAYKNNDNFHDEVTYSTSSKQMADDIGELIMKVGGRPSFYLMKCKGNRVHFRNGTYKINRNIWIVRACRHVYFGKRMKVEKVHYRGMVYCVTLPRYHTLLIRRNGKVMWCGNCMCYAETVIGDE